MKISLLAALGRNRVIGFENRLPWHLPDDMKHFRETTTGHSIVMGRRTFESVGRPLPDRNNIVLSRQATWCAPGVEVATRQKQVPVEEQNVCNVCEMREMSP